MKYRPDLGELQDNDEAPPFMSAKTEPRRPIGPIATLVLEDLNRRVREILREMGNCACETCVGMKVDDLLVGHGLVMSAFNLVSDKHDFDSVFSGVRELLNDVPHRTLARGNADRNTCHLVELEKLLPK